MDLNDHHNFVLLDKDNMYEQIITLPAQLVDAWMLASAFPLEIETKITRVCVSGMGGSAIGADLMASYVEDECKVPVFVHRNYGLPAWAVGPETLFIASSHSGNTEETLSAYDQALENGCKILSISTGGKLAQKSKENGTGLWLFNHKGQPRAAVGFSFGLMLAAVYKAGLIPDPGDDISTTVKFLQAQKAKWHAEIPVSTNPAKRLAGQCVGRCMVIMTSDMLVPIARRWKGQVNELAKSWCQFDVLPEADHNTLAGVTYPQAVLDKLTVIFIKSEFSHRRNQLRANLTQRGFMTEGINTDSYTAEGKTKLQQLWDALLFGDYVSYYLAMANDCDPTPIPAITDLKKAMQ